VTGWRDGVCVLLNLKIVYMLQEGLLGICRSGHLTARYIKGGARSTVFYYQFIISWHLLHCKIVLHPGDKIVMYDLDATCAAINWWVKTLRLVRETWWSCWIAGPVITTTSNCICMWSHLYDWMRTSGSCGCKIFTCYGWARTFAESQKPRSRHRSSSPRALRTALGEGTVHDVELLRRECLGSSSRWSVGLRCRCPSPRALGPRLSAKNTGDNARFTSSRLPQVRQIRREGGLLGFWRRSTHGAWVTFAESLSSSVSVFYVLTTKFLKKT
jgi:hypothetical protein